MWYKQAVHYPKSPEHGPITDSLLTHSDRHQYTFDSYRPQSSSTFRLDDYPAFWHTCSFPKILPRKQTHPRITMGHRDADAAQADATSPVSALFAEASPTSDIINHPFGSTGQRQENFAHNSPKRTTTSKPPRPVGSSRPHPDRTSTLPWAGFRAPTPRKTAVCGCPQTARGPGLPPDSPDTTFSPPRQIAEAHRHPPKPQAPRVHQWDFPFPHAEGQIRSGLSQGCRSTPPALPARHPGFHQFEPIYLGSRTSWCRGRIFFFPHSGLFSPSPFLVQHSGLGTEHVSFPMPHFVCEVFFLIDDTILAVSFTGLAGRQVPRVNFFTFACLFFSFLAFRLAPKRLKHFLELGSVGNTHTHMDGRGYQKVWGSFTHTGSVHTDLGHCWASSYHMEFCLVFLTCLFGFWFLDTPLLFVVCNPGWRYPFICSALKACGLTLLGFVCLGLVWPWALGC